MKLFFKRVSVSMLAFVLVTIFSLGSLTTVQAAEPEFGGDEYQFMYSPEWRSFGIGISNLSEKAKITVSVDKKKIATAIWDEMQGVVLVFAKKPGTVKVKVTVKQNGKTYKHTTKVKWVKYKNPLKSLQIGNKKYNTKYFDKNTQAGMKKVNGNKKLKIKLKKGYKLTGLGFSRAGKHKNIKNGSKINFTKKGENNTVLFINYKDSKGNLGVLRLFVKLENGTLM